MPEIEEYKEIAKRIRREILEMIYKAKMPHIGSAFSIVEILVALYFKCLSVSPENKKDKNRDIFILSKGHSCSALYAVLAERGFFKKEILKKFAVNGGLLEGHPTRNLDLGIEVSTGSLGHGLSIGAGIAVAKKFDNLNSRVFVLLSDGETQEGSVWEAALFAAHHQLDNLIAIIDYNKLQALDKTENILNLEPFKKKWESFSWQVKEIDGHDFNQIIQVLEEVPFKQLKPSVIIAHTKKGKGVSFMEDNILWHSKYPDEEEFKKALKELN